MEGNSDTEKSAIGESTADSVDEMKRSGNEMENERLNSAPLPTGSSTARSGEAFVPNPRPALDSGLTILPMYLNPFAPEES